MLVHNCHVLQTGGNTLNSSTAKTLNKAFGTDLNKREIGRALEKLKKENDLRNDRHGKIMSNGDYVDDVGNVIDNIGGYVK